MTLVHVVHDIAKQVTPAQIALLAGFATTAIHGLLKRYKNLSKPVNQFVSVLLPVIGAVLATLVSPASMLVAYPAVFTVAQLAYRGYKAVSTAVDWLQLGRAASTDTTPAPSDQF